MNKSTVGSLLSVILLTSQIANAEAIPEGYQLQQVLMMSRHNLRAPKTDDGSILEQSTAKHWPKWDVPGAHLTTKGGVLEVYMGHYLREWLAQQGLVKNGECPTPKSIYIYANSMQRTVATAQFFVNGAFPGCDIPVHHQAQMETMDPTFNPVITNDSPAYTQAAVAAMETQRKNYKLDENYKLLERVIAFDQSPTCKEKQQCNLTTSKDIFSANANEEPSVRGPLKIGYSLVDAFTLQDYEGFPSDQVAWGQIKTKEQWQELSQLKNSYQDTLFTSPEVAKNVAAPLVKYIKNSLLGEPKEPKITLLVGHDSNIASLLTVLNFKPYQLPEQYERTPIGGKIMFQRWYNDKTNSELMKVEYVYQSTKQLRNGQALSLQQPPKRVTLQLEDCPTDANGFCPWNKFTEILDQAATGK